MLRRFRAQRERDALLIVPTRDDVELFERELANDGAALGGAVTSLAGLVSEVARATGVSHGPPLTRLQRTWLARAVSRTTELRVLRSSAGQAGFSSALESLVSELRGSGIDADTFAARAAADGGDMERELARLNSAWEETRARLGRDDPHSVVAAATRALKSSAAAWGDRPIYLYGFDELAPEHLELLRTIAGCTEVTVAVAYEDRASMAARARLLARLREDLGAETAVELGPDRGHTTSETLFHLERSLFEPGAERHPPDDGLALLRAGGERGELELIGERIAGLLDQGVPADEIAIVVRDPGRRGSQIGSVLARLGVPVAVEAHALLPRTGTGTALLSLLRVALGDGSAGDLVRYLRLAGGPHPTQVDWLERTVRRRRLGSADAALADWEERDRGRPIEAVSRLRAAASDRRRLLAAAAAEARRIAEGRHRRAAPHPGSSEQLELRAGAAAAAALAELDELADLAPGSDDLADALALVRVPMWQGTVDGRVRVLSPSRLRASRPSYVFCSALQDGEFPGPGSIDPLLSDDVRAALALEPRAGPAEEERYLFFVAATRAAERLYLSYHDADGAGRALARSPFIDEVRDLLAPAPPEQGEDRTESELTTVRPSGQVTSRPERASTEHELTRALAAMRTPARIHDAMDRLGLATDVRARIEGGLRAHDRPAPQPGPLAHPALLGELAKRSLFGASTLEEHHTCSYRWFVDHELEPQRIDPDPEPLSQGAVLHTVLERLYATPPGDDPLPRGATLPAWQERAFSLVSEELAELELDDLTSRVWHHRLTAMLRRFLAREAASETPLRPDRALLEARFGEAEEDDRPPVDLGGWLLHGRIDRVDVSEQGAGVIRDYKLSRQLPPTSRMIERGRLQLPLYALALREAWGLETLGALYHPLGATRDPRPRGPLVASTKNALLAVDEHVRSDFLDPDDFEEMLELARATATERVALIREGAIDRDPRENQCPAWCRFQSICRIERSAPEELDDEEDDRR